MTVDRRGDDTLERIAAATERTSSKLAAIEFMTIVLVAVMILRTVFELARMR